MPEPTKAQVVDRRLAINTDDWPERERLARFRDDVGRDRVLVEPLPGEAFRIDGTMIKLPGLGLVSVRRSALRSDFADGGDRLMINLGGSALAFQGGREVVVERGEAIAFSGAEVGRYTTLRAGRIATIEFPNGSLAPQLHDRSLRSISGKSPALQLLRRYVRAISADVFALPQIAVAHLHDLAVLALGAAREAGEIAQGRGLRAARLQAIKQDVLARLGDEWRLTELAARHHVSPRYVRLLFEGEGTSFSEFVREERLKQARRMLASPRFDALRISEIAYAVGFNDLSYFNRSFRRRFDMTPSDLRELSRLA